MDLLLVGLAALAVAVVLLASTRRRASTDDASEAVRRDLGRLVDELKVGVRAQVERLDREVRRLQEAVADAERARLALDEARLQAAPKPSPASPSAKAAAPKTPANPLHSRVFELRDSGKEPADIGVETGLEVGEVELILGLRRMPPRA